MKSALYKIIRIGLYLILFTPLLVIPSMLSPQITPKALGFEILVEIIAAAAILLITLDSQKTFRWREFFSSATSLSIGLFLAYSFLTSFFGYDPKQSLWGIPERQDGLFFWLHFLAWMIVIEWFRKAPAPAGEKEFHLEKYLRYSFVIAIAVALTALLETAIFRIWGKTPWILTTVDVTRPSGVFGNPTFNGPYLCFHFFIGLVWIRDLWKRSKSHFLWLPALLGLGEGIILFVLALGQTRGVVFGLGAALVAMGAQFSMSGSVPRKLRIVSMTAIAALFAAAVFVWTARDTAFIKGNPVLSRITMASSTETSSIRLLIWQSVVQGFQDRPVFGWGHDNVSYVFNKYFNPEQVQFDPSFADARNTWADKSHNAYLDLLVEKGVLGFLLFFGIAWAVIQAIRRVDDWFLAGCFTGSMVSYAVSNGVAFDSFGSLFGLFLMISYLIAVTAGLTEPGTPAHQKHSKPKKERKRAQATGGLKLGVSIVGLAVIAAALIANLEIGIALYHYAEARSHFEQDANYGLEQYQTAFAHFSPYEAREKLKCAYLIVSAALTQRLDPSRVNSALEYARDAVAGHPNDVQTYTRLNDMYNGLGIYADKKFLSMAEAAGKKALELSPRRQESIMNLGRTYLLLGQNERAIELGKKMVGDYDKLPVAHWFLGLSLLQAGQKEQAKQELAIAFKNGYSIQNPKEEETIKTLLGEKEYSELRKNP
jgi:O-antigen ligase